MDTDDLSNETYNGIILEAEKFTHDLTVHFGALASSCKDEKEYLKKAEQLAREICECDDFDLEDLFFGNIPDKTKMHFTLNKILQNIREVKKIPISKRHFEF